MNKSACSRLRLVTVVTLCLEEDNLTHGDMTVGPASGASLLNGLRSDASHTRVGLRWVKRVDLPHTLLNS